MVSHEEKSTASLLNEESIYCVSNNVKRHIPKWIYDNTDEL